MPETRRTFLQSSACPDSGARNHPDMAEFLSVFRASPPTLSKDTAKEALQ
jgi:hypothetical protein